MHWMVCWPARSRSLSSTLRGHDFCAGGEKARALARTPCAKGAGRGLSPNIPWRISTARDQKLCDHRWEHLVSDGLIHTREYLLRSATHMHKRDHVLPNASQCGREIMLLVLPSLK